MGFLRYKRCKGDLSWNMQGWIFGNDSCIYPRFEKQFIPNYPNPFNPTTSIDIQIAQSSKLLVQVFDAKGRLVNTLINNNIDAGYYHVTWNGKDSKGYDMSTCVLYLRSGVDRNTQKIILLK